MKTHHRRLFIPLFVVVFLGVALLSIRIPLRHYVHDLGVVGELGPTDEFLTDEMRHGDEAFSERYYAEAYRTYAYVVEGIEAVQDVRPTIPRKYAHSMAGVKRDIAEIALHLVGPRPQSSLEVP